MKRKWLIRLIIGIAVFAVVAIGLNQYMTTKQGGLITVVNQPSYPVMEIADDSGDYNLMPAYESAIDLSLIRNQIAAVDTNGQIRVKLYCYDYDITAIQYALFENGEKDEPLEEGTLNQLEREDEENTASGTIQLTKVLDSDTEYYLQLSVRLDRNTKTYFYTKVKNANELHLSDYITFAKSFHEKLFDRANEEELITYLEPDSSAADKSFERVDITSTINSVFYGDLALTGQSEPRIKVKELNKTYGVIEMTSVVSDENETETMQYYNLTEVFKLRYTTERIYLLDYRRTMGAVYNGETIDSSNNYLGIGIQREDAVSCASADEGHKVSFVNEGQLWYYDYDASKSTKIYSIKTENLSDVHNDAGATNIKILSMTDDGEITYILYGYMNRGSYEGKNGIAVMVYHPTENYSEETGFFETSVPYEMMNRDLDTCAYLNESGTFYCLLDGDLHTVSLTEQTDEIIAEGMMDESLTVSSDGTIVAFEKSGDVRENTEITLLNLKTEKATTLQCDTDERIRAIGFILQDFIYAVAKEDNIKTRNSGAIIFPANFLQVVDSSGESVKKISKNGKYIMDTEISGTVIEMQTASLVSGKYKTNQDKYYVRYKKSEEAAGVALTYVYHSTYWNQLYFSFPSGIYIKVKPSLADTTLKAAANKVLIALEKSENTLERYFVYAGGELLEDYTTLTEAIKSADEERGNVIDAEENIVWQCVFSDYAQVPNMTTVQTASSDKGSLRACLRMVAALHGIDADARIKESEDQSAPGLLAACSGKTVVNLSGTGLDAALYYVDTGAPVLTKLTSSRYVIVMSYNKEKVRYLDPVTGESTVVDRDDLTAKLKKQGNIFYSYLK